MVSIILSKYMRRDDRDENQHVYLYLIEETKKINSIREKLYLKFLRSKYLQRLL